MRTISNCYLHSNSLSNKMDNSLLAVRDINHKYIVVEEKEAVKMMTDTDKRRMTNYNFYTDQRWGKADNYTLCLNSSELGYDRCEKIIMECIK